VEDVVVVAWILVGGLVGFLVGRQARGQEQVGAVLGAVFGPLGWLITLLLPDRRPRCFECGGVVVRGARSCLHCGRPIDQMFDVRCPACGKWGQLRESLVTERVECPECHGVFQAAGADKVSRSGPPSRSGTKPPQLPAPPEGRVYLDLAGKVQGPFTSEQIEGFLQVGAATLDTPCCVEGSDQWQALRSFAASGERHQTAC